MSSASKIREIFEKDYADLNQLFLDAFSLNSSGVEPDKIAAKIEEKKYASIANEFRSAMSHMGRTFKAENENIIFIEAERAIGHIERARRDCLKHLTKRARKTLEKKITEMSYEGIDLPLGLIKGIEEARKLHKDTLFEEITAPKENHDNNVANKYRSVYDVYYKCSEMIVNTL